MQQKIIVWDLKNFAWRRHLYQLKYSYKYIRKTKTKNKIKYRKYLSDKTLAVIISLEVV